MSLALNQIQMSMVGYSYIFKFHCSTFKTHAFRAKYASPPRSGNFVKYSLTTIYDYIVVLFLNVSIALILLLRISTRPRISALANDRDSDSKTTSSFLQSAIAWVRMFWKSELIRLISCRVPCHWQKASAISTSFNSCALDCVFQKSLDKSKRSPCGKNWSFTLFP